MSLYSSIVSALTGRIGMLAIGYGIGSAVGIAVAKTVIEKKLIAEYDERLEKEVRETKRFYKALNKKPITDIPEVDMKKNTQNNYRKATKDYTNPSDSLIARDEELQIQAIEDDETPYPRSYEERERRVAEKLSNKEAVTLEDTTLSWSVSISMEEFFNEDSGFDQVSWTYFSEDDVMADERNEPVSNWQDLVDEQFIKMLDHGATQETVCYIRDKYRELEYEITLDTGSYTATLGIEDHFEHENNKRGNKVRKFRSEDE